MSGHSRASLQSGATGATGVMCLSSFTVNALNPGPSLDRHRGSTIAQHFAETAVVTGTPVSPQYVWIN